MDPCRCGHDSGSGRVQRSGGAGSGALCAREQRAEAVIDGLAPGAHAWSVHEYGDFTRGTGPAYNPTPVCIYNLLALPCVFISPCLCKTEAKRL